MARGQTPQQPVEGASAGMAHVPLNLKRGGSLGGSDLLSPLWPRRVCHLKAVDDKEGAQKSEVVQALQETLHSLQVAFPLR